MNPSVGIALQRVSTAAEVIWTDNIAEQGPALRREWIADSLLDGSSAECSTGRWGSFSRSTSSSTKGYLLLEISQGFLPNTTIPHCNTTDDGMWG